MVIVTNGLLVDSDFVETLMAAIKKYEPNAVYLREKHLSDEEYYLLAVAVVEMLKDTNVKLFISHRIEIAKKLGIKNIHISFKNLTETDFDRKVFTCVSVAVHNVDEALQAEKLGADIVMYGHIFPTECKQNALPQGLDNLNKIVQATPLPVVAIGGINKNNVARVLEVGASDFAVMSSAMRLTF